MIGIIGLLGCMVASIVAACVTVVCTAVATGVSCHYSDKEKEAIEEAEKAAEKRQLRSQSAQRTADKRQTNAARQAAARGILLARIDNRQTINETNALNRKYATRTGDSSGPRSLVYRRSYHSGTPAQS